METHRLKYALFSLPLFTGLCVLPALGSAAPDQPLGLKGVSDPRGRAFTILWEPVKQRADGTALNDSAGYNVYRRTTLRGPAEKINSYLLEIPVFADRVDGKTFYYSVRAVDAGGAESADSFLLDSSAKANIIFLADDGHTTVTIPGNSADVLRPGYNKYGVSLTIRLKEEPENTGAEILRSVRFQLARGDTKEEVRDVVFPQAGTGINIGYNVIGGQITLGAPGTPSSQAAVVNATPEQLSLYWSNDVRWIKLGGSPNRQAQTVDVKSSQLGSYQLRVSAPASALNLSKANVFPGLFTPNGDGFNDRVYLVLENPNGATVTGEIFDLSGRYVATLPAPTQTAGVGTTLIWSGKDSSDAVVASGLYVYRIDGEGKTITGTVSVAR